MSAPAGKYLYLPLEIVVREHDGKVTLAHEAALQGWTVVMGPKLSLYAVLDQMPEGVCLIKSATPGEFAQIDGIRQAGHRICSLDEEGVVTFKEFLKENVRFSPETVKSIDRFFFWGPEQKTAFTERYTQDEAKGHVTGSPRLEFWRDYAQEAYAQEIADIRKKYGRYILIPSSFGIGNNVLGGNSGLKLTQSHTKNASAALTKFMVGQAEQNLIVFKEFLDYLPELAQAFPEMNFILRPHPSESHKAWEELTRAHPNFHLVYEGSVTPWILASEAILHFKSTTSVEAHLMGVPPITYLPPLPPYMEKYELVLPMAVSRICRTREELAQDIKRVMDGEIAHKEKGEIFGPLKDWIHVSGENSAAQRLMMQFESINPQRTKEWRVPELPSVVKFRKRAKAEISKLYKNGKLDRFLPEKYVRRLEAQLYGERKYKDFNVAHTQSLLNAISNVQKIPSIPVAEKLTEDLFVIRQK